MEDYNVLLPISEYQKRFFLEWALAPKSSTYNTSLCFKITGKLNKQALIQACDLYIKTNPIARAKFNESGNECYPSSYEISDIYHELVLDFNKSLRSKIKLLLKKSFDLTKGKLLQFYLLSDVQFPNEYYFIIRAHHIIFDGSMSFIIQKDLALLYNNLIEKNIDISHLDSLGKNHLIQLNQLIEIEKNYFSQEYFKEAKKFWLDFISDIPLNVQLPYKPDFLIKDLNNKLGNIHGKNIDCKLDSEQTVLLKQYAKNNKVTLFLLIAAIYGVIVSKYSNQNKILINYPVNMRPPGYKEIPGCFINNTLLKTELDNFESFEDLIKSLASQRKKVIKHQGYLLTNILYDQQLANEINIDNYFNVSLVRTNLSAINLLSLKNVEVDALDIPWRTNAIYELELLYDDSELKQLKFRFSYRSALFDSKIINFLIESFLEFIKKITIKVKNEENTRILLGNFYLLSDLTYNQTIKKWNNTENNYSTKKSILQLFEEQTKKIPTQIAVVSQGIKLSYHELNVQANQLAHFLQQKYSLQGDDLIAICLDRSEQILIAILAVLKAGAAYVPLDPNNPDKRISYILQDTEAKAILANSPYQKKLVEIINYHQLNISLEIIDSTELKNKLKIYPPTNVPSNILSNNLAYIIYTSGTTGTPKGVMIEHSSLINYTLDISQRFNVENNESAILISEYIFDLGNTTLFPILINGGTIHIPSKEQATSHQFIFNYINYNDINWIKCTPLYFEFVILNLDYTLTTSFKKIILGGEICSNSLKEYLTNQTNVQVFNHYGPTETTIGCICNTDFKHGYNNIIGKPLANTVVFILDKFLNILPIGAMGELYIGGAGLARGYLNLTDLTLEKFIKNPFQTEIEKQTGKNSLLYKTGDLARYLPDGSIQYLGRNDLQVKVRGFRIELGEIENQLVKYPRIKQVIVLAREHHENKTHYLVGYYVADNRLNENKILEYLSAQLPDYMVPNILVFLDKLPLTINGKLDRKALPDPEFNKTTEYIPPRNDLERKICEMYAEVLGLSEESIGIHDNFFRLGGNSILAIKLVSQMNKIIFSDPTFHLPPIQVIEIFKHKRILDSIGQYIK